MTIISRQLCAAGEREAVHTLQRRNFVIVEYSRHSSVTMRSFVTLIILLPLRSGAQISLVRRDGVLMGVEFAIIEEFELGRNDFEEILKHAVTKRQSRRSGSNSEGLTSWTPPCAPWCHRAD